jgi:8-oxo-dGTP diphosphatase
MSASAFDKDSHHKDSNVRPAVGVGVMLRRGSKLLLGRRQGAHGAGSFGWPGGGLAFDERLEDAVRREAFEEAGVVVNNMRLLCVSNVREYGRHYIDFEFVVEDFSGEPRRREAEFTEPWQWYDMDNLPSPLFRPCALALESLKTGRFIND